MKNLLTHTLIGCALVAVNLSSLSAKESQPITLAKLEKSTLAIAHPCRQATVGMTVGTSQGTGVIVSAEGLILTAFHCVDYVGREFEVILSNGTRARAIAVYGDENADIALATILDKAPEGGWPYRPLKMDGDLKTGDWCVAFGNSAGIQSNRPAPMRIGRVLGTHEWHGETQLITDNTLVSGDSGGPIFDLKGRLVGINSNVGNSSAMANHHARVSKIVKLWGDTLCGEKPIPSIKSLREIGQNYVAKHETEKKGLTPAQRKETADLIKQQYGRDFPQEVLDIILDSSKIGLDSQALEIELTVDVMKKIQAAGFDPVKIGLINEAQANALGLKRSKNKTPKKSHPKEKKTQKNSKNQAAVEKAIRAQFKNINLSDEAMAILSNAAKKDPKTGSLKLSLTDEVIENLKKVGVDLSSIQDASMKPQIIQALQKKFGNTLSKEAINILFEASTLDKKTGVLKIHANSSQLEQLQKLGIDVEELGISKLNIKKYQKMAEKYGDSCGTVTRSFPKMNSVILVFSAGKQVLIATPVTVDGYLVTKSSELANDKKLQVEVNGKKWPAKIIARDEQSDLVLLKVDSKLKLPKWSSPKTYLGQLLLATTANHAMLGIVSNRPRIIPNKLLGVGNGNKAILGIKSLNHKTKNSPKGVLVEEAGDQFAAGKGGVKKGDLITAWNKTPIKSFDQLLEITGQHKPGDEIQLTVQRNGKTLTLKVILEVAADSELFARNSTSSAAQKISAKCGNLSKRRVNFPECITHDALLWAEDCGGPVYNRQGQVIGVNIARYDRTACYALTRKSFDAALKRLLSIGEITR